MRYLAVRCGPLQYIGNPETNLIKSLPVGYRDGQPCFLRAVSQHAQKKKKKVSEIANAGALSRLPLQTNCTEEKPVCCTHAVRVSLRVYGLNEELHQVKGGNSSDWLHSRESRGHVRSHYAAVMKHRLWVIVW